jgi:hypothetical protein
MRRGWSGWRCRPLAAVASTWVLLVAELPSGRLAVDGLPLDRDERLSVTMRLLDTLRAVSHADSTETSGTLWVRYAKGAFVHGWLLGEDEPGP